MLELEQIKRKLSKVVFFVLKLVVKKDCDQENPEVQHSALLSGF